MAWKETKLPCPSPECGSSDAYSIDDEDHGHCFSCGYHHFPNDEIKDKEIDTEEEYQGEPEFKYTSLRGIPAHVRSFYKVQTKIVGGIAVSTAYPWGEDALKIRKLNVPKNEAFSSSGPIGSYNLFGKEKFPPGSKNTIVITEGEEDAMAVYEMLGYTVAAVSVKNASTAYKDVKNERDYINSFKKIVLCLDNDKSGQDASRLITGSGIFDYEKLYRVEMGRFKDANEFIDNLATKEFVKVFEAAKRYTPDSIINSFDDIKKALGRKDTSRIGSYPFSDLEDALKGFHRGEFILVKGLEGIGKTEICRAFVHHNLKTTALRQATIFLEEAEDITIKGVVTYELEIPANSEESGLSDEDIFEGYKKALGDDESRVYIHTHFSSENENEIVDNIRFLVTVAGCEVIYLDNLTMLVTGREGEDERLRIDRIIRRLRDLVNELHFCLVLIAHVNDNNQTRGSRLPDKLANTVIIMERNIKAMTVQERNMLHIIVEKARTQGSKTGPAGGAFFDPITYKLRNVTHESPQLPPMD